MSEFFKRFLMDDGRKINPDTGRFIALGAFGKHPGWDDHVEDLGLETDSLNLVKSVLYVQGVGGQIDKGAWEKLKDEQRLPVFNHTFVWQRNDQFLAGRMWSSSDGKGRTRYPMIICAHCEGVTLPWILNSVLPRLEEAEIVCRETKSAEDVRSVLGRSRTALRNMIISANSDPARDALGPSALQQFISSTPLGPAKEGLFRIMYWLKSQAAAFGAGRFNPKGENSGLRAKQVRVPILGVSALTPAIQAWTRFFSAQVDPTVPVLLIWPKGGEWLDVTIGEPTTDEFFCLRAARTALPLATEVPYDLDAKFREQAAGRLDDFQSGRPFRSNTPIQEIKNEDEKPSGFVSVTQRWFKSLGGKGGIFLICLAGVAAVAFFAMHLKSSSSNPVAVVGEPIPQVADHTQRAPPTESSHEIQTVPPAAAGPIAAAQTQPPPGPQTGAPSARSKQIEAGSPQATKETSPALLTQAVPGASSHPPAVSSSNENTVAEKPLHTASPTQTNLNPAPGNVLSKETAIPTVADSNTGTPDPGSATNATVPGTASPTSPTAPLPPPQSSFTNGIGMVLKWVAGLPASGAGGWVGKFEVTQAEYEKLSGSDPSVFHEPAQPVENITFTEAADYCRKLNATEKAAGSLPDGFTYSLPTDEQWDFFLADAGFDDAVTSRGMLTLRAAPERVGTKAPNRLGLCDVFGNVWEWCSEKGSPDQGVMKGGGYDNVESYRFRKLDGSTVRHDEKSKDAGFRCVLAQQP